MEKERENFYRIITLILHLGTKAERDLLKYHLKIENVTLQYLLSMYEHDLYHLFYNMQKCCKCTQNYTLPRKRILNLMQLEILFDKNPTRPSGSSSTSCNNYGFCCCQLSSKPSLTVDQLDFTLTRCLLINCCEKLFCNSMLSGSTLETIFNNHKHELYHVWQAKSSCCLCSPGCNLIGQNQSISNRQWSSMYGITNIQNICHICGSKGDACTALAVSGISMNMLDKKLIPTILKVCCPLRKNLEDLTDIRNTMYGHALEPSLTDQEFDDKWPKVKTCIVSLVEICGTGTADKFRDKIDQIKTDPLDGKLYQQYHTEILKEIKENRDLKEEILKHLHQTTDQMTSKQDMLDSAMSNLNAKLDKLLKTPERHIVSVSTQSIQTDIPIEEQDSIVFEFSKKIEEKENDLSSLDGHIFHAEDYKMVYSEKIEDLKQMIKQRSKAMQVAILNKEDELLQEINAGKYEAIQNLNEYIQSCYDVKQKGEKKIANYKKMLTSLQEDKEMTKQFAQDSLPMLTSMNVSVKAQFPRPLTFEWNATDKVEGLFGILKEDQWFGVDGKEKPRYRRDLDVQSKFKVEYTEPGEFVAAVYQIIIRPDHKAWVSTSNYNFFLVNLDGTILTKKRFKFLISRSACDKLGNLFCSDLFDSPTKIRKVCLKDLELETHDFPVYEFEDMYPFRVHDLYINNDDQLLVLLGENETYTTKITVFSKARMVIKEIELGIINPENKEALSFMTQDSNGKIFISGNMNLVVVEASGKKIAHHKLTESTWEGKSLVVDPFGNIMSTECPKEKRPLGVHITDTNGKLIKTFTIEAPRIYGLNALKVDSYGEEPLLWMSSIHGHVIVAKFVNTE